MEMKLLTQIDLDRMALAGCQAPGCTHQHTKELFFNSRCHPRAAVEVKYEHLSGKLVISCAVCHRPVADIAVLTS